MTRSERRVKGFFPQIKIKIRARRGHKGVLFALVNNKTENSRVWGGRGHMARTSKNVENLFVVIFISCLRLISNSLFMPRKEMFIFLCRPRDSQL